MGDRIGFCGPPANAGARGGAGERERRREGLSSNVSSAAFSYVIFVNE